VVQAYVADISVEKDRAKALGWLSAVTSLGAVIGPAIGSLLVRFGGHTAPGLGSAILCALVSVFAWRFLRESRTDTAQFEAMHAVQPSGTSAIQSVIFHPNLPASRLIWIYAIGIGAFYGTTPMLPLILAERLKVNDENVGYFIMYLGLMGVVVRTGILGRVIERLGEPRVARIGLVFLGIGLASVALIRSYPTLAIPLTLMPIGTAFIFPCTTAMLSRVVSKRDRGLFMGVQHTFGGVSRVAFPVIAGYAMDVFGKGVPFVFAGAMVLSTLLLTLSMEKYAAPVLS